MKQATEDQTSSTHDLQTKHLSRWKLLLIKHGPDREHPGTCQPFLSVAPSAKQSETPAVDPLRELGPGPGLPRVIGPQQPGKRKGASVVVAQAMKKPLVRSFI